MLQITFYENGEVMCWGAEVPSGIEVEQPADWATYSTSKYVANASRTGLSIREGWSDPAPEGEPAP